MGATSAVAFGPSTFGRSQVSMRVGTFDKARRQKFNKILNEVKENPTKEVIQDTLLATDTGDLIEKCNWKLRKAMIRKVNDMASEFNVDVDDGFGVPPTQEEREAKEQEGKTARAAEKKAALDEAAKAVQERKESKATRKAEKAAVVAENLKKIQKDAPVAANNDNGPQTTVDTPEESAPTTDKKSAGGDVTVSMIMSYEKQQVQV